MFLVLLNLFRLLPLLFLFECFHVAADLCAQLKLLLPNSLFFLGELLNLKVKGQLHFSFFFLAASESLLLLQFLLLVTFLNDFFDVSGCSVGWWLRKEFLSNVTDNEVVLCPSTVGLMGLPHEDFRHKIVRVFCWLVACTLDSEVLLGLAILFCQALQLYSLFNLFLFLSLLSHLNS